MELTPWNLRVAQWFEDRNLIKGSNPQKQFTKLIEEFSELYSGAVNGDMHELKDGIGDTMVVLCGMSCQIGCQWPTWDHPPAKDSDVAIADLLGEFFKVLKLDSWRHHRNFTFPLQTMCILLNQIADANGLTIGECQEQAWDDIKDRTGRMIDGVFVKDDVSKKESPLDPLKAAIQEDSDYAWTWQCNLACMILDTEEGQNHRSANLGAADFMKRVFDVDVTGSDEWKQFEQGWISTGQDPVSEGGCVTNG